NIEVNHATLSGHDFQHEIAMAAACGILGSVDANRGDDRLGWDTDQFPNSVEEMSLGVYEILRAGGFTTGGFNFDTKLRRMSIARDDLFHAHIGGMDTLARSLLVAHAMLDDGVLEDRRARRYEAWGGSLGSDIHAGIGHGASLAALHDLVAGSELDPAPVSGRQEELENLVNRYIERTR
ncbi:MAG: xylose isomerase, partial [Acidimicrobiales bacterium]